MKVQKPFKPMPLWESALIFFIFTALGIFNFYVFRPWLERLGLNASKAYLFSLSPIFVLMLIWALVGYAREKDIPNSPGFSARFRLGKLDTSLWLWGIGLGVVMFGLQALSSPLLATMINNHLLSLPAGIPDYINPTLHTSLATIKNQFISHGVLSLIPCVLILNIASEELFWRGYVFPRQQLQHGRYTFLVHGIIWAFSHLFQYWLLGSIMLGSIALSYVAQRTRSTWPGIVGHLINNLMPLLIMSLI